MVQQQKYRGPRNWPISVRITGIALVTTVLMLLILAVFGTTVRSLTSLEQQERESQHRLELVNGVKSALIDMETGLRGYRLTGEERFLEPYYKGQQDYDRYMIELRQLMGAEQIQTQQLQVVENLHTEWLSTVSQPTLAAGRSGDKTFDQSASTSRGKELIDRLRVLLTGVATTESYRMQEVGQASLQAAQRAQRTTRLTGLIAIVVSITSSLLLARNINRPLQLLVTATENITTHGGGTQVEIASQDEIGRLGMAFNKMSASLSEQQMELAAQNEELQAIQEELTTQNEELQAQQEELSNVVGQLEWEKGRLQRMNEFSDSIVTTSDLTRLGQRILASCLIAFRSQVGALILTRPGRPAEILAAAGLTDEALAAGARSTTGLVARALEEKKIIVTNYPAGELLRPVYHTNLPVQSEAYVPLFFAGQPIGVIVLGRTGGDPYTGENMDIAELWARQAGAALSNALAFEQVGIAYSNVAAILRASSEGIRLADEHGANVIVNDRFWQLLGLQPGEELPAAARAAAEQVSVDPNWVGATTIELGGPEPTTIHQFTAPAVDQDGRRIGRVYVLRDVTRETEVDRMKTEFISTVSHELRTPLTAIRGYVDLMLEGDAGEISGEQREYLQIVSRSSIRLANLISDLLDVEKIESGRIQLRKEEVDVAGVLQDVVETFRVAAAEKGLALEFTAPPSLPLVLGDGDRLTQVFTNLLSNAIKYTKSGSVRVDVHLPSSAEVLVEVTDTGIGLSPDDMGNLFTKFFRVDNQYTREVGGTGLGLAISQAIVQKHAGEMRVESQLGRGSTFSVTLPTQHGGANGLEAWTPAAPRVDKRAVLVIEDDPVIARLIAQHVERQGLTAVVVGSGPEGLQMAKDLQPALITLDVMLPGMDGWEVIAHLKRDATTAPIPVIFISVLEEAQKGLRLGAAGYLTKPLDPHRLVQALEELLPVPERPVMLALLPAEQIRMQGLLAQTNITVVLATKDTPLVAQLLSTNAASLVLDEEWSDREPTQELDCIYRTPGLQDLQVFVVDQVDAESGEAVVQAIRQHLIGKI